MMKKKFTVIISGIVLLVIAIASIFSLVLFCYARLPIDRLGGPAVVVDIPNGAGFLQASNILADTGLVRNRPLFFALARVKDATKKIRAGEYELSPQLSPSELIDKLVRGETMKHRATIIEDWSLRQIAAYLKERRLVDEEAFLKLAYDKEFLKAQGIEADSAEGYLFPDTYFFERSMTPKMIMKSMIDRFEKKIPREMIDKAEARGLDRHELVTFASLVGKEAANSAEKPLIAAVFHNRMKKKMPLQSDPTTVYDLTGFDGKILRSHYKRESPYNTYLIRGLPPGPISNPGLDSFKAVINPEEADYLYFVARGDGTHVFTDTLDEHNKAVAAVRKLSKDIPKD